MVKVRLPFQKSLIEFENSQKAFEWVRETQQPCTLELLIYEHGNSLEAMDRYHFDGDRFIRENILN